jgi:hypothetical protein
MPLPHPSPRIHISHQPDLLYHLPCRGNRITTTVVVVQDRDLLRLRVIQINHQCRNIVLNSLFQSYRQMVIYCHLYLLLLGDLGIFRKATSEQVLVDHYPLPQGRLLLDYTTRKHTSNTNIRLTTKVKITRLRSTRSKRLYPSTLIRNGPTHRQMKR